MSRKPMPKSEKTKASILKAAIELFSKKGYHGSAVDEIAARAAINKERIYAYFGSKEALFETALVAVYEDSCDCDKALLELSAKDVPGLSSKILSHYMELYRKKPEFWRMIAWANLEYRKTPEALKQVKSESLLHLKSLFEKGRKDGVFAKALSFEVYIYSLWALTFFHSANRLTLEASLSETLFKPEFEPELVGQLGSLFEKAR